MKKLSMDLERFFFFLHQNKRLLILFSANFLKYPCAEFSMILMLDTGEETLGSL